MTTISVRSDTASYAARLANNGVFLEMPTTDSSPDPLVISYTDGTSLTVPLGSE